MALAEYRLRLMARLVMLLGRWFDGLPAEGTDLHGNDPVREGALVWTLTAVLAAWSHLATDLLFSGHAQLSDWGLKLFWPFSARAYVFPVVRWGDVLPTLIFVVGMFAMLRWRSHVRGLGCVDPSGFRRLHCSKSLHSPLLMRADQNANNKNAPQSMTAPRPNLPLIICSYAGLTLCAVLCAGCTAVMLHPWGIRGLGALLLLPGFLGLGLTQYAGTFQAKAAKAEMVARLYSFTSGFMLIALVCLLFDIARLGQHPSWPVLAVGAIFVFFAIWGRIGGRLNREWAAELRRYEEEQETGPQNTTRHGPPLVWATTCTMFLLATAAFYWGLGPQSGENVAPGATPLVLPEGSSDVCYWIYAGNTVFEFSISEQGFLAWAERQVKQRESDFKEMKAVEKTATIPTYRTWLPNAPPPRNAVVEDGYFHALKQGSKTVRYAYDLRKGRAYYAATNQYSRRQDRAP